jgi:hypothetical protein
MYESEVARIRRQIEEECVAMNLALQGFAISSRHEFIRSKYRILDGYQEQLGKLVGEDEATEITMNIYWKAIE